ncbi:related to laccase precursor [Phialocephala subalpina]|uniref:Related to laccase n=1 Tax=Phialocephala subalpina TaxID=576137 RepID=A0A1L7WG37_9HELO|nr:related to laccase precursor [Phialocephala subalpina]
MKDDKPSGAVGVAEQEKPRTAKPRFGKVFLLLSGLILVIVALALGLGLGLGLKHHHSSSSSTEPSASATPSSTPSGISENIPSWRRDPSEYNLDMDWDINAAPTTRIFNITVSEIQAAPDGVVRTMLVMNGQFPGPLIRVNEGDRVLVNVTNELKNGTSMHWHGLYQNGTNWMDGTSGITQCPIPPGTSFLYNFTVTNQFGTYWYHSHVSSQYTDGLVGPFVVHSPSEAAVRSNYDYDQVILLQDWYHDLSSDLMPAYLASGNENAEPLPDNGLIQGTNYFNCSSYDPDSGYTCQDNSTRAILPIHPQKRHRLRLINTGAFGEFSVSIDNHTLSVIEADSTLIAPATVHRLPIHIAQRYSIIVNFNQSSSTNYWFRAQMNEHCFSDDNPVLDPDVLALISYSNTTAEPTNSVDWSDVLDVVCKDLNTTLLVPLVPASPPKQGLTYQLDVSFQIGAYALDKAYINSTTWTPSTVPTLNQAITALSSSNTSLSSQFSTSGLDTTLFSPSGSQFVLSVPSISVVDILLNNLDEGAHPFHLHGHQFWELASGPGDFDYGNYGSLNTTNPMRRDTMTVNAYGWSLIRFVADNPGLWALHCHISTRADIMKTWTLPADVAGLCSI